jgi:hypothetical protein
MSILGDQLRFIRASATISPIQPDKLAS